ncbi:uncharacterized protein [Oryza sativa Japonica Group]|uniref:uncharacterized protein n=1 Tax=Oryza sativa subsp. japonica TaxID=39947 RepID=UPI00077558DF|nr:uncharacterized protein LOC112936043 isoform X2 [Oryza sativa Japonica Group]KAF2926010.1 hypothetical protein DAI22_06g095300 [Oryza sativa Japonica Group]
MSLCCFSSSTAAAAAARRFLLPHLFLGRRRHRHRHDQVRYTILHHPRTHTTAAPPAAAASTTRLSPSQQRQVSLYVDALLDWNQRMNLTAVTDEGEVMTRHVADSLAVLPPLERAYRGDLGGMRLVDVGSGAGLPGLILAVARPSWKFTLLESMQKRCLFLEHAVEVMGLSNVDVVCDRAENVGQSPDFREAFDVAVARAVAELKVLAEYCLPLVRIDGLFIAAKGHNPHEEIKNAKSAVHKLGASMLEICDVESMGPHGQRTAVVYIKECITPKKYPRHPGTPSKMPL